MIINSDLDMVDDYNNSNLEQQKIELVKLRLKNGYYDRDEVYQSLLDNLVKDLIPPTNESSIF